MSFHRAIVPFILTSCLIGWLMLRRPGPVSEARSGPALVGAKCASDQRVNQTLTRLAVTPSGPTNAGEKVSEATRQRLGVAFDAMARARSSLHRDRERAEILVPLVRDPEALAAAREYLLDLDLTRRHFGEHQAEARLYAIELLTERAKQGDRSPIEATTRVLAGELARRGARDAGRERDLEDLIAGSLYAQRETALAELGAIVRRLGYAPALRKPFIAGVYFALQGTNKKEAIVRKLEEVGISPYQEKS